MNVKIDKDGNPRVELIQREHKTFSDMLEMAARAGVIQPFAEKAEAARKAVKELHDALAGNTAEG